MTYLRAHPDGEAPEVDQTESHAEVREEVAGALRPTGQPGCSEKADPQTEQRGHDVPLGRSGGRRDVRHLGCRLAGHVAGHHPEEAGRRSGPPKTRRGRRRASARPPIWSSGGTPGRSRKGPVSGSLPGVTGENARRGGAGRAADAGSVRGCDLLGGRSRGACRRRLAVQAARSRGRCRSSARRYWPPRGR